MTKVLLSCVGEDRPSWHLKIENLVLSVRRLGDAMAEVPIVVNFVDNVSPDIRERLACLDAKARVVEKVDPRAPSSNKLRMLELPSSYDFDVLVALDCDLVVQGDLTEEAARTVSLRATPAILDPLPPGSWETMYRELGLVLPERRHVMTVSGQTTYPYFNSGVLFVARDSCERLREHWDLQRNRLLDLEIKHPGLLGSKLRGDQPALACALASSGLEVDPLPLNLNLSTRVPNFAPQYQGQWGPPFILHYHDSIDERGFLMRSPHGRINPLLHRFNQVRAEAKGIPYDRIPNVPLSRRIHGHGGYRWVKQQYGMARRLALGVRKNSP